MQTALATASIRPQQPGPRQSRDRELVCFVGRHGIVAIEHVMSSLDVGSAAAYRRVAACIEQELLERLELLRAEPSLLRATREGLRYAGLGFPVAVVSPGSVGHWLRCASVAQRLVEEFGPSQVITERELAFAERVEGRPIASAKVGELPNGAPQLHRPDLAILADTGPIAVEVELTPKSPKRLEAIIRAWRRAHWVAEVRYYCAAGQTRRALERTLVKLHATERIAVYEAVTS
jgi:hypothetical protein